MDDTTIMMNDEDTFDITLISTIEVLLIALRQRQADSARFYLITKIMTLLDEYEQQMYEGFIPEEYKYKAARFDANINAALKELQDLIKGRHEINILSTENVSEVPCSS